MDRDWATLAQGRQEKPSTTTSAENLAYVLYTSGSTGKPKGVSMKHHALCNLVSWQIQNSTLSSGARTLQFAPLSFDVSFQEIFSTLCSGGTLMIVSEEVHRDPGSLLDYLANESVERLFLPFVALQQLAEVVGMGGRVPQNLREVITAGEQLRITPPIARMFERLGDCSLHNQYGPTESHVVTVFSLLGPPSQWPALPPIGRPIANIKIYLLDHYRQPVSVGVVGEVYIGGDGLARGYHNRPELTAERFIPNPFSEEPGARLYRTGDLARYLPDGNIEFLGRIDHQVKVRGYRIEPGEIEAVLGRYPAVRETVVIAGEDKQKEKRLVAYVSLHQGSTISTKELRNFLKEKLPDYMVPSAFVILDVLPLTPTGKIDRKALPTPDSERPDLEDSYIAPSSPIEKVLADIWSDVLGLSQIGIHDNFFELGGHSLLATQVISRLRKVFGIEIPLRTLFESPTVEKLAFALLQREGDREKVQRRAALLQTVAELSEDEVNTMLAEQIREGDNNTE